MTPPARRLFALLVVLSVAFMLTSSAVGGGALDRIDGRVARLCAGAWSESADPVLRAIGLLGGVELTTLVTVLVGMRIWRVSGLATAAAVLVLPVLSILEALDKRFVHHPGPGPLAHGDAPTLTSLISTGNLLQNSFPSGHAIRAVVAFGLAAFVYGRLRGHAREAAAVAVLLSAAVGIDRLYLEVHWVSDVIGGLLLGSIGLVAAMLWMELRGFAGIEPTEVDGVD